MQGTPISRKSGSNAPYRPINFECARVNRYHVSMPDDWVPLPQVAHEGDGYRLLIEVLPDPSRDVVLILYRLTGDNMNLYPLLAPHLSNNGEHDNARAADDLTAWKDDTALCLLSDSGFSRSSAGYVGASDGWQDFSRNGRMTWEYGEAIDGNVALLGELPATQGTLAIGFSDSGFCARYNNREGFRAMRKASPWPVASDEKGHCRLHGGASGSVALLANGVGNTVTASGPRPRLRALLKMLRAGLTEHE